jgi:hypothetical protein
LVGFREIEVSAESKVEAEYGVGEGSSFRPVTGLAGSKISENSGTFRSSVLTELAGFEGGAIIFPVILDDADREEDHPRCPVGDGDLPAVRASMVA